MSEVRLLIADREREIGGDRHGGFVDRIIAALTDDPETIDELEAAMDRFIQPDERGHLHGLRG